MSNSRGSFLDLVMRVAALLGAIIGLVGVIVTVWNWTRDPQTLLIASVVGYVVFSAGILWFAFKSTSVPAKWRWVSASRHWIRYISPPAHVIQIWRLNRQRIGYSSGGSDGHPCIE